MEPEKNRTEAGGQIAAFRKKVEGLVAKGYECLTLPRAAIFSESMEKEYLDKCAAEPNAIGGDYAKATFSLFNSKQSNPTPVDGCGTEGLGYIPWGPSNALPNTIFNYASTLPYTAAALKYITDLTVGLGPKLMYKFARYSGGTVEEKLIPFEHAGTLIKGRMREVRERMRESSGDTFRLETIGRGGSPSVRPGSDEEELSELEKDLEEWERSRKEIEPFLENNNLELHYQKCMTDDSHMDIYFPTIGLSIGRTGEWRPKIVSVDYLPAVCTRLEEMDSDWHVNYVYYSEKWRQDATAELEQKDVVAYPAMMPDHQLSSLRKYVERNRHTGVKKRGTWVCCPIYYPSMLRPYYPQPAWWSIFPSQVYSYASTLILDKAIARKNATMWGKMIFINLNYLKKIYDQEGADTPEKMESIKAQIYETVEQFLRRRENNGKTLFVDSFLSQDEKTLWKSLEIVDVPQPASGAETKDELEEISSIIFFALGIHPALIGAVPGKSGSTGGTFQRELQLLKQQQVSPRQRNYLRFLQNICAFNEWDSHAVWVIREQVLTTLDRSKTGTEGTNSEQ